MIEIVRVQSRGDLSRFIDLPWRLYDRAKYPHWVPPLRMAVKEALDEKGNPFYKTATRELFLASRDGKPVGRIAAIENRAHNDFHKDRVGFFGFFECADDQEAATALVNAACAWLRGRGLTSAVGPMSPSTNHECGLLVDGFDLDPMIMTPWNPPYHATLLERAGFVKEKDLVGYDLPMQDPSRFALPERYARLAERAVAQSGVVFRDLDLSRFQQEIDACWSVYNSSWETNWGFVPMTREEFAFQAKEMRMLLRPEFAFLAEVRGEPVGFMLLLLDYNIAFKAIGNGRLFPTGIFKLLAGKKTIKHGRIIALGIKPEFRTRSIFPLFAHEIFRRWRVFNGGQAEASWILADNLAMVQPMEAMGSRVYKRWRIYTKAV